jgi:hypothetical protein
MPRARSGGLLLGVRVDTMDVLVDLGGDFHIKLHTHNKSENFRWTLVAVYQCNPE